MDQDCIRFPLKIKNYNELRAENYLVPRILVVVAVPRQMQEWLQQSEEELVMRHCGYWVSLRGKEDKPNVETVTVLLPRNQLFTVEALKEMMERISTGGMP